MVVSSFTLYRWSQLTKVDLILNEQLKGGESLSTMKEAGNELLKVDLLKLHGLELRFRMKGSYWTHGAHQLLRLLFELLWSCWQEESWKENTRILCIVRLQEKKVREGWMVVQLVYHRQLSKIQQRANLIELAPLWVRKDIGKLVYKKGFFLLPIRNVKWDFGQIFCPVNTGLISWLQVNN